MKTAFYFKQFLQSMLLYSPLFMKSTVNKKFWLTPLVLIVVIILLHLFALQPAWVENIYSAYIYPSISYLLRFFTRWIPFSLGDVLYGVAIIWLLVKFFKFFSHKPTWQKFFIGLRNLCVKCLWIYIFFMLAWGLNYYRLDIGYSMNLIPKKYSTQDLITITSILKDRLNTNRKLIDSLRINYPDNKTIFKQAIHLYDTATINYFFLNYKNPDVKKMLAGVVGNYSGFLGYYNPFTGEAQVNTKVPAFITPYTACHEIGHQIGYASESEASFAGYLVVKSGNSPIFNYSAYFDLFGFANGELYRRDSVAAKQNAKQLDTLVKKDYAEYRNYLHSYKNPVEPLLTILYGNYLKAHNQPKGIDSYDEVVAWVVAYYKKYGTL